MIAAAVGMAIRALQDAQQAAACDHGDDGYGTGHGHGLLHDAGRDEVRLELEVGEVADAVDGGGLPARGEGDQDAPRTPAIMPPTRGIKASSATTNASRTAKGTPTMDITMNAKVALSRATQAWPMT